MGSGYRYHLQKATLMDSPSSPASCTKQAIDVEAIGLNLYRSSKLWKHEILRSVYGGQVVSQAMTAAEKSLDNADFLFHSLHCYFVNPTKGSPDVIYEVEKLKDGKSFCTRSVKAWQEGRIVFQALVSLYKADAASANLSHSSSVMPDVPRPPDEDAKELDKRFIPFNFTGFHHVHMYMYVPDEHRKAWKTRTPVHPRRLLWAKSTLSSADSQNRHRAALAYASDASIAGTIMMKYPGMETRFIASVDHSILFHESVQADKWHLFVTECEHAVGGSAHNVSKIFCEDGRLVATCCQESLIRQKL